MDSYDFVYKSARPTFAVINLKSLTVSFSDNSPPPMPSNGKIVLPTDLTLSPMSLLAYELACSSAGITVVRTNKSSRMEDNKAAA